MAKVEAYAVPVPSYLTDGERTDALHNTLEGLLRGRDYQELAHAAGLAHRYQQLAHIIYQIDDLIENGPRRNRHR